MSYPYRLAYFDCQQKESGCRCIIDQCLVAAIAYAQGILESDEHMKQAISNRFRVKNPQIAVFTELPIPHTRITYNDTSYTFHGLLDYGIGFIKGRDLGKQSLGLPFIPNGLCVSLSQTW